MYNPAARQEHKIGRIISKDKQLSTNCENAFFSDLLRVTEAYAYPDKNGARLYVAEADGGTQIRFEVLIKGWKSLNYLP